MADPQRTASVRRGRPGPLPTQPCGTNAAYKRHQRAGEPPCEDCKAAWAEYQREMYVARKLRRAEEAQA